MRGTKLEKFRNVRALVRSGLSQSEAARQLGVPITTAHRWSQDLVKARKRRIAQKSKPKVKRNREPEITLTAAQQKNVRDILNSLAGGRIDAPQHRKKLSDELTDEEQALKNYVCKGGASDEVIATATAGVTDEQIERATQNARLQLRDELERGLENAAFRAAYIRGAHGGMRLKPNDVEIAA